MQQKFTKHSGILNGIFKCFDFDRNTKWEHTIRDAEPHDPVDMTARDIHSGAPNAGSRVVNTSVSSQPTTTYAAATRKTFRRRNSAKKDNAGSH